jgi:P4 family phage/plasmid primase-like protien
MKYQNLDDLLRNNKCPKDKKHTHTRIPNKNLNVYGGSYYISDEIMPEFWNHYYKKVWKKGQFEYLTERQLEGDSRLAIDFDFRYDTSIKERQHTEEHITDAIGEICKLLNKHLIIEAGNSFEVYVFEKPNLNCLDDITKDGIHVIVNINVPVQFKIIMWQELWPKLSVCWEDLPITNSWESVLDKGVFEGGTNWQVFGSRKPLHEAYALKYNYVLEKESNDEWSIEEMTEEAIKNIDYIKLLPQISVRNNSDITFDVCDKTKQLMEEFKKIKKKKKKKPKIKFKKKKPNEITSIEQIEEECKKLIKQKHKDDLEFEEIHNYTIILGEKYFNEYEYWIKLGWALKNTNDDYFWSWMLLSSKSEKFKYDYIEEWKDKWDNEFDEDGGLTSGSIRFWAKESNFDAFKKIRDESIQTHIQKTITNYTDFDIAKVLHLLYREEFVLAAHERKKWFRFKQNRWFPSEKGSSLRLELSNTVSKIYLRNEQKTVDNVISCTDDNEQMMYQRKASKYAEIGLKLRKTPQKNNIMIEAADLFHDENFYDKLDENPNLICFKNGVIDLEQKRFRQGAGTDYLSMSTHINYIKIEESNENHMKIVDEINDFMEKLFPNSELRGYMWQHMASILPGHNDNQTFHFYLGVGSNGKSLFVELLEKCLGDYKGAAPLTMITGNRTREGQATPEIVSLKGKRYAVLQEAKKNTVLNEGTFKEYTGCDSITGRPLYGSKMITFKPMFNMILCTNYLPEIRSTDNGTWRRIRVIDFESRFEDNPDAPELDHLQYVYKKNKDLKKRFDDWAPILVAMLVDIAFKTQGAVEDVPKVMAASTIYRDKQDYFTKFMREKLEQDHDVWTQKRDVYEEFRNWFLANEGKDVPKGKELFDFLEKKYGEYNRKRGWRGFRIALESASDDDN